MTPISRISAATSLWMLFASTQLCAGAQTNAITGGAEPALRAPLPIGTPASGVTTPIPMGTVNLGPTPESAGPPATSTTGGATVALPGGGTTGLGSQSANQPLQATVGAVELDISGTPVAIGPYIGVKVRVANNTNSPILLDGDRAAVEKGGATMPAVSNSTVEETADPPEPASQIARNFVLGAATIGAALAIKDQLVESGPVLGRFGGDERRREASALRFGKRIVWTGDSTEGMLFFPTSNVADISGGNIKLPIVTFPQLDVRGYVQTAAGTLPTPVPPVVPNLPELTPKEKGAVKMDKQPKPAKEAKPAKIPPQPLPRLSPP